MDTRFAESKDQETMPLFNISVTSTPQDCPETFRFYDVVSLPSYRPIRQHAGSHDWLYYAGGVKRVNPENPHKKVLALRFYETAGTWPSLSETVVWPRSRAYWQTAQRRSSPSLCRTVMRTR